MSLDALSECTECKKHTATRLWIQVFSSFEQASHHGNGNMDFLSSVIPGPGLLKVEVCFSCRSFRPFLDFTKEEEEAINKHKELNERKARTAENLNKLLGGGPT